MKGSQKQTSWAKDIKQAIESMFDNFDNEKINQQDQKMIEKIGDNQEWETNLDRLNSLKSYILEQDNSEFYINNFKDFNETYQKYKDMEEDEQDWFQDRVVKSFVNSIWNCDYEGKKPSRKIKKYINLN